MVEALEQRRLCSITILLDFDGEPPTRWLGYRVPATPEPLIDVAYVVDRVRAAFAPFEHIRIEVEAGPAPRRRLPVVIIGGNGAWQRKNAGGVAQIGGAFKGDHRAWVFSRNLIGDEHIARLIVHEAAHLICLGHQGDDSFMGKPFGKTVAWHPADFKRLERLADKRERWC